MVTVWWSAASLIHYSFLNPRENITSEKYDQQIDEMHWKLQHLQPATVNRKGPLLLHDNNWSHFTQSMLQKSNNLGYKVLPQLSYSPDLSPHSYHFFKHFNNFAGQMLPQPAGCRNAFQEFIESQCRGFYTTGINFSPWQKSVDCNGSYFD